MAYRVVPIAEEHIEGFRAALDSVARELRYLAMTEAPPPDDIGKWVRSHITSGMPQFVAIADEKVVGWCDVSPKARSTQSHIGVLGMGVMAPWRGRGIGRMLVDATLKAARAKGLTRVELTVRVDNAPARRLYQSFGFVEEGICKRHLRIDGEYADTYYMAVLYG